MCGFQRPVVYAVQPLSASRPDFSAIVKRLNQLQGIALSPTYAKQKASLKKEFSAFLCSLPGNMRLFSGTPKDVCRFLAWKDSRGKTQVHATSCPNLGKHNVSDYGCPTRLSFATVDSYIGKLRAVFKDAGREATGKALLLWGTLRLPLRFTTILKLFRPSSYRLQSLLNMLRRSSFLSSSMCPVHQSGKNVYSGYRCYPTLRLCERRRLV